MLSREYVFLIRAHYEVGKVIMEMSGSGFIINVSDYHSINELMIASDILISDYSSIFFDFSILERPMLCFAYDLENYKKERGLYLNIEDIIPGGILKEEKDLLSAIINMNYEKAVRETIKFRDNFIDNYGNASKKVVEKVFGSN